MCRIGIILGIILIIVGIQLLFNTENFLQKVIEFQKLDENSIRYKSMKNKAKINTYKFIGAGYLVGGTFFVVFPFFKYFLSK